MKYIARNIEGEVEAEQWSGSNWHLMLDFAGRDVVSTDGSKLFAMIGGQRLTVPKGNWLIKYKNNQFRKMPNGLFHELYEVEPPS